MSAVLAAGLAQHAAATFFLDPEVICVSSPYGGFDAVAAVNDRHVNPAQVYRDLFLTSATCVLKQIHDEMDAAVRYVISSTWRESFSREQLKVVFRRAGLGFVADCLHAGEMWRTPPKFGRSRRIDEIAEWLDRHHRGEPFAVLDDTHSGASLMATVQPPKLSSNVQSPRHPSESAPHSFAARVFLCDENVGLNSDHLPFILAALRREVPVVARVAA